MPQWNRQSQDLNLMEMLRWDLKRAEHEQTRVNFHELKQHCEEELAKKPQSCERLVRSCKIGAAKGASTSF